MVESANFWNDFLLVVIPVLIGGGVSTGVLSVWQIQKEKFRLKKEKFELRTKIHDSFQESFAAAYISHLILLEKIKNHYSVKWFLDSEKKQVQYDMDFSTSQENLPKKIFADEFENYFAQANILSKKANQFFSLITIYFDSSKLDTLYANMSETNSFATSLFRVFFSSETKDELANNYKILSETLKDLRKKCIDFADAISDTKLKDPPD